MSTHHGYLNEFPFIRVDNFDGNANWHGKKPLFYLLTHAHTDHIRGLDSPTFNGQIYATAVTKKLVQETIITAYRVRLEEMAEGDIGGHKRFANLCRKVLPLNTPTQLSGPDGFVTVTALDANHCPGSAMFLIEGVVDGKFRSCLITGDIRIEPWWLEALKHNPIVAPYIPCDTKTGTSRTLKTLDCVYLDTSSVLLTDELPTKDEAVAQVIALIAQYPPDTRFFLNAWTWGYEEMLKGIYKAFGETIHLDRYKHRLYTSSAFRSCDPLLATLGTTSSYPPISTMAPNPSPSLRADQAASPTVSSTSDLPTSPPRPLRFHACERRWKCDHIWNDGLGCFAWDEGAIETLRGPKKLKKPGSGEVLAEDRANGGARVVYVNPSEMPRWRWEAYKEDITEKIEKWKRWQEIERGKGKKRALADDFEKAELPNALIIPLARHSSCPELQSLVALFRPQTIYPLTCTDDDPDSPAHQYMTLPSMFGNFLAPGGDEQLREEAWRYRRAAKKKRGFVAPSSAGQDDPLQECGLIEPKWVREMTLKGLNLEGPFDVVKEVGWWLKRLEKDQQTSSRLPAPLQDRLDRVTKSPRTATDPSKAPSEMVVLSDTEDEEMPPPKKRKTTSAELHRGPALARQLSYGETSSATRQPPVLSTSVVPPTATPAARQCTPEPSTPARPESPLSVEPPLRRSVTFAASPTSRPLETQQQVVLSASPSCPSGSLDSSPELVPSGYILSTSATSHVTALPTSANPSTSSSASVLRPIITRGAPKPAASRAESKIVVRPSSATREHRHAVEACLLRKMRGLLCEGGKIRPFAEGDPRLQGRKPLCQTAQKGEGKENEVAEWRKGSTASPSSFRTVAPSTSPLA
ncbi:DNA cross-link repair 1C protein [Rhodotorula toruloides]|uniref:DNA cross-link repair 1C protein n=1 Tax=Rhodotorula toruloides TaxID=5286 RepID=A0A511KK02_RHOTO|nr:DNA cross-link repair 1C protein [Rhodotorula toruloides]